MQRILLATDGSTGSDRALDAACTLATAFNAALIIVTVAHTYLDEDLEQFRKAEAASVEDVLYALASEILVRAQDYAAGKGIKTIRTYSGTGDAVSYILDIAKKEQTDIIVAGKRGRGRLSGLLIGSVSQKLVSLANCKVMIVP